MLSGHIVIQIFFFHIEMLDKPEKYKNKIEKIKTIPCYFSNR